MKFKKLLSTLLTTTIMVSVVVGINTKDVFAITSASPTPVSLGTSGDFTILSKTGISSVPISVITGDIGVSPIASTAITGFSLTMDSSNEFSVADQVSGHIYAPDYASPTGSKLTTAVSDMETAYTDATLRTPDYSELYTGDISGQTLTRGVYKWSNAVLINSDVTISGSKDDIFIFQMSKGITQATGTKIILTGGAQAKNIFWQTSETVTMGADSHFEGILLSKTNVILGANASVNGRLLAQTAITLISNTITPPSMLVDSSDSSIAIKDTQVNATVDATVTISVSTNSIDFGNINPLVPSYDQSMTVTIQSNNNYLLSIIGGSDLIGVDETNIMTIDHLKVQLTGDVSFKDMAKTPVTLIENEPNTANKTYNINLKLTTDWQVKPDIYGTTITFKAEQL